MSIVKSIYKIKPKFTVLDSIGAVMAHVTYEGITYVGIAAVHEEDKDFFSEKVGKTIALSKARQEVLKAMVNKFSLIYSAKRQMLLEVTNYGNSDLEDVDPTLAFYKNAISSHRKLNQLKKALKDEKAKLKIYLKDQDRAISIVKSVRKGKDN